MTNSRNLAAHLIVQVCSLSEEIASIDESDNFISELSKHLVATGTSKTLKIHVLLKHTKQCLQLLDTSRGLGLWSEQAREAAHCEFLKYWEKRKITKCPIRLIHKN